VSSPSRKVQLDPDCVRLTSTSLSLVHCPSLGAKLTVEKYGKALGLSYDQFRFAFVNAVNENEAKRLYDTHPVPGSGIPLFQAALANLNPATEAKVDTRNPKRGPMKLISGQRDNTAPWAIANASYKKQRRNPNPTEIEEIPGRGHSLVFDSGWEDVAQVALAFIESHRED